MALTASGSPGAPNANCVINDGEIVPNGQFNYRLTLNISGAGSITNVTFTGGPAGISCTKLSNLSWTVTIAPGETVFPDESFEFVQYDADFNPTFYEVETVDEQPPNSSVFIYNPPIPFSRTLIFSFLVEYVTEGTPEGPGGVPPAVLGTPASETIAVSQTFVWDPDIGLGQLDLAIENSVLG